MFEKNTLTFNQGWDKKATQLESFTDITDVWVGGEGNAESPFSIVYLDAKDTILNVDIKIQKMAVTIEVQDAVDFETQIIAKKLSIQ